MRAGLPGTCAFLLSNGQIQDVGLGGTSETTDLNEAEQVVCWSLLPDGTSPGVFLYSDGIVWELGVLANSQVPLHKLNEKGQASGRYAVDGVTQSYLYNEGVLSDIPTINSVPGGVSMHALNDLGQVVGSASGGAGGTSHAFLYSDGATRDIDTLGSAGSAAVAINNRGEVVGWNHIGDPWKTRFCLP